MVVVSWTAPSSNGGATLQAYRIKLLTSDGVTFVEDRALCDGSNPTTRANQYCTIPMEALWASPYALTLGSTVVASVEALNTVGYSTPSVPNSAGATV